MRATLFLFTLAFSNATFAAEDKPVVEDFVLRAGLTMPLQGLVANEDGLKIMWWNVGCSSERGLNKLSKADRAKIDPVHQWSNLQKIVKSERLRPDVLILGEYCPKHFDPKTYELLASAYPHIFRLNKTNPDYKIRNGFRVFSKYKIRDSKVEVLNAEDFVNSPNMFKCEERVKKKKPKRFTPNFWNRSKISFSIEHNRKKYQISPVHLANPWSILSDCIGRFNVLSEILEGEDNANYIQALSLAESFSDQSQTILIGDFNAPKQAFWNVSRTYVLLREAFGESVVSSTEATFSDPRRTVGHWSIDHAFVSGDIKVKEGVVLPFAGSDHLPIYIVVTQ